MDRDGEFLAWRGGPDVERPSAVSTFQPLRSPTASDDAASESEAREPDTAGLPATEELAASTSERRPLTVMFCDLADSTELSTKLDPEDLQDVIRAYQNVCAKLVKEHEGFVAKFMGDGILVYFGYPKSFERDAERAVSSGLAIIEAIQSLNETVGREKGVDLTVRIGVATGMVMVGEIVGEGTAQERTVIGEAPNLAARLQGVAGRNGLVIGGLTKELARDAFVYEDLGARDLKGISGQVQVWGVVGHSEDHITDSDDRDTDGAADVPELIGRDEEAGLLRRAWASTREEGRGQVVTISGEAGIGKSVLIDGLRAEARNGDMLSATFRCSPYHTSSTLYPMIAFLKQLTRWRSEDTADTKLAKLERTLEQFEQPLSETVPLIAALMSLSVQENRYPAIDVSPQQQKQMTQDALISLLMESAENKPLLTLWEDLHWADPSTLELLGLLIDQAPTGSLLILATARPEFIAPWAARSHITPITLNRLERTHAAALCARIAGDKLLPAEVIDHIVVKTDGVPLYVEELTKTIIGSEILQDAGDCFELSGPLESLSIPDTLQASLMARLDRLPQVREIAQLGSVLGREFAYQMILGLSNIRDATLQEGLDQLVDAELLYQRGRPPRARYVFKHALVMDAAYNSLLRRPRQQYHRQVAELLEAQFSDIVEAHPELLAHHFSEAGEVGRAVVYWQTAGQKAIEGSANPEAISHLDNAIEQTESLPKNDETALRELKLQTMLAGPLITIKGYGAPETKKVFTRALELSNQVQDPNLIFPVLYQQWISNAIASKQEEAQQLAGQFLNLANKQPDALPRVLGHRVTAVSFHVHGDQASAKLEFEKAANLYDEDLHGDSTYRFGQNPKSASLAFIAATSYMLGYPDQAKSQTATALAHAEKINHVNTTAYVCYYCQTKIDYFRRDLDAATESTARLLALANEHGLALWHAYASVQAGWVASMQGDHKKGVELARAGLAELAATGTSLDQPFAMAQLGEVLIIDGQDQEALKVLDEAIELVERTQERLYEVELYRMKGQLLASSDQIRDEAAAEKNLKKSIKIAKTQRVKIWELRAATNLADLLHRQGKTDRARKLLEPIHGWFTEGFDTHDLKDAETLLASLRK